MRTIENSDRPSISVPHGGKIFAQVKMVVLLLFFSGCGGGLSDELKESLSVIVPTEIDFTEIDYYAKRSEDAYKSIADIRAAYPLTTRATTVQPADVRYFIETDMSNRTQTVSVRGTAERINVIEDIETALIPDSILGIAVHRGFQADANAILDDAEPHLNKDLPVRITGHSLGGAVAAILALYLEKEGYTVARVVTFGQPRFSTEILEAETVSNTLRVLHDRDVVPMLPPYSSFFGAYRHLSPEVILREGGDYIYLNEHDTERLSVGFFWRNILKASLSDHHMGGYRANIKIKIEKGATQIPYLPGKTAHLTPTE